MPIEITPGYDIRALAEGARGPAVWAGAGAEALGLTGTADPADLARVFSGEHLEDQAEPLSLPEQGKPVSLLDQMRLDGTL